MLQIESLSVEYYRRGKVVPAVKNLSLSIDKGEAFGLVGESGSGKSTIALAVLRLIRHGEGRITGGRILLDGVDLLSLDDESMRHVRGKKIAMIFQDPFTSLNPVLPIRTQMAEALEAHGEAATEQRLTQALDQVQLETRRTLDAYPHQLSGGQRQRVMIATALINRPQLILADEPTTALDVLVQKEVLDLMFSLQRSTGVSVLFISHHLALVANYVTRLGVLKDGVLVESGPTKSLLAQPATDYARTLWAAVPRLPA
jgi:ABC-type glutathione transport system ATPase component